LRRDRRVRLEALRAALDHPLPEHARAKIVRIIERLELVLSQIAALESQRDAVLEDEAPEEVKQMIQALVLLRSIGAQSATVLYEAFIRRFANGKVLGCYAGLTGTRFNSGGGEREQGICKAGNRRPRAAMGELACLWLRYQQESALAKSFRERLAGKGRLKKALLVALARKLLIALWRYATDEVIPEGAVLKPA
jgi:transposase